MSKRKETQFDPSKFLVKGPVRDYCLTLRAPDGHVVGVVTRKNGRMSFRGDITQTAGTMMQIIKPLVLGE